MIIRVGAKQSLRRAPSAKEMQKTAEYTAGNTKSEGSMTIQEVAIEILKYTIIIVSVLMFSVLVAWIKRDFVETLKRLYHKCIEVGGRLYDQFLHKLKAFHVSITGDYVEKSEHDSTIAQISEAEARKGELIHTLNNTIESVDSFGSNVSSEIKRTAESIDLKNTENIRMNNNTLRDKLDRILALRAPEQQLDVSVKYKL